ncbi:hypothetical protein CA13_24750 [Planctomycetes bacterium CA13]|uniref:3-keto-alpha-glucoside-1,2-lyase/3-keto-2-hydroxy-glucal hydratase domain-containing protein n=1 Tax=Novipirellula herctigrandis TaxID=2527986 RepID=A0A5C5Z0X4_9BACT|nr:hypothetical protein CA13_24750 [Planctomycetes bacterium CA13]
MKLKSIALCLAILAIHLPANVFADAGGKAYTDTKSVSPDFALQGEYRGTAKTEDGDMDFGGQVIALGKNRFQIVGHYGGLPGEGWKRGDKQNSVEAKSVDGKIVADIGEAKIEIADGEIAVFVDGNQIGTLKKLQRESPTLGAKPPANATVLFDGTSADQFEKGELVEGNLLGSTNCFTKQKFGDHKLHIEFRTPFMPNARGQGRGNSGVYMQGRYELQVLDSFGLDGKNNECGGIYKIAKPIVNMCLPPLSWQTYDIDFTAARYDDDGKKIKNARVSIKHNGAMIHNDLELPNSTPGFHGEGPEPDSLFLQHHGNPVAFRNIWIVEK